MTHNDLEARLEALEANHAVGEELPCEWMENVPRQLWSDPTAAWRHYVSK